MPIKRMNLEDQYDDALFDFSRGNFESAIVKLTAILAADPTHFDAQLSLGMAYYRQGDFAMALTEGHKAEKLKPREQLAHTNLSLFYLKAGNRPAAEHHGLQARIASWRTDPSLPGPSSSAASDPELALAKPKPPPMKPPEQFPAMPWKKK